MQLFYCPDLSADVATLDAEESRHAVKVLRLRAGDALFATDGLGQRCRCRVLTDDPSGCLLAVEERETAPARPFRLHLAVAPTKNAARIEWLVEKAVEIGVDEISLVICDHSERGTQKTDRLQRIALSAMKQSLRSRLPRINDPLPLRDFLALPHQGQRLICYCDGDHRTPLRQLCQAAQNVVLLIGPEGDFSPAEVQDALARQFLPVTLGDTRLRTETAALYALTALNFINS